MKSWMRATSLAGLAAALACVLTLTSCTPKDSTSTTTSVNAIVNRTIDDHSYAKPQEARVISVDLDLTADFESRTLRGTASLTVDSKANAKQVILDTKALDIEGVTDASGGPLKFSLGKNDPMMGRPLTINLPQGAQKVVVHYRTTKDGTALQWLDPAQTAGHVQPFLFSQGEEINTRTWIPTQDSPAIRQTYTARIVVPRALTAVMSADGKLTPDGEAIPGDPDDRAFRFTMSKPIAPYLIALAVGDIGFKAEDGRTGVYAEKAMLDKVAYEFADMGKMVDAAEKLYGPYQWGRYDVLVLPPSFPYGGMENPTLTFATPTVIAGDRSLVSLVAHELAHSWSGNLVTNATWEDFWLNEGFTVYFENRIMEQVYGKDRADMLKVLGYQELQGTLKDLDSSGHANFTELHPDLKGINPDDYFTDVPYEKGAAFLRMLEAHFGRAKFDAYLKGYFHRYAFKSMTTEAFLADLRVYLLRNDSDLEKSLKIHDWIYGKDLPDNVVVPTSPLLDQVASQVKAFIAGADPKTLNVTDYTSQQWQYFLIQMPDSLTTDQMATLDKAFSFTQSHNDEILFDWLMLTVKHQYKPALPALETFLTTQGRAKFCQPLYEVLMKTPDPWGPQLAKRIYAEARPGYHALTREGIDPLMNPKKP